VKVNANALSLHPFYLADLQAPDLFLSRRNRGLIRGEHTYSQCELDSHDQDMNPAPVNIEPRISATDLTLYPASSCVLEKIQTGVSAYYFKSCQIMMMRQVKL